MLVAECRPLVLLPHPTTCHDPVSTLLCSALDEVTCGNQSLRILHRVLAKPGSQPAEAGALLLLRTLRPALRPGGEATLLVRHMTRALV